MISIVRQIDNIRTPSVAPYIGYNGTTAGFENHITPAPSDRLVFINVGRPAYGSEENARRTRIITEYMNGHFPDTPYAIYNFDRPSVANGVLYETKGTANIVLSLSDYLEEDFDDLTLAQPHNIHFVQAAMGIGFVSLSKPKASDPLAYEYLIPEEALYDGFSGGQHVIRGRVLKVHNGRSNHILIDGADILTGLQYDKKLPPTTFFTTARSDRPENLPSTVIHINLNYGGENIHGDARFLPYVTRQLDQAIPVIRRKLLTSHL